VALTALPAMTNGTEPMAITLALPAPGDPLGLAGPGQFSSDALDAGEAVLIAGVTDCYGLVPRIDARTVLWNVQLAHPAPLLDPGEASRTLRQVLLEATAELVRLDVAHWQPAIPDLLLNLRHRPGLELPPDTPPAAVDGLERATLCLEIVELARADDGGAISGSEIAVRSRCLTDLDLAARRAIVALCSASLGGS
jgi:hypothetical protein